ncbi:hypothetical protein AVEN_235153-1, partial [Araneus ventricosus]
RNQSHPLELRKQAMYSVPLSNPRQDHVTATQQSLAVPDCIFTNPTLIELRQEIGHYDWLASPRADDVVLCSRACTFH